MGFIKRENLKDIPYIQNNLNIIIRDITIKIGVPIEFHQSVNAITKYRGKDLLGFKKIQSRSQKLNKILNLLKCIYKLKKEKDAKYKDKKITKVVITKNYILHFLCTKSE